MEWVEAQGGSLAVVRRPTASLWLYAALTVAAAGVALSRYGHAMDGYEQAILLGSTLGLLAPGACWPALRWFCPLVGAGGLAGIGL